MTVKATAKVKAEGKVKERAKVKAKPNTSKTNQMLIKPYFLYIQHVIILNFTQLL